jgi:CheY-like chemotaxis protein
MVTAPTYPVAFLFDIDNTLPRAFTSDPKRLQQILKNLLSNAFKFTAQGHVAMSMRPVTSGWSADHPVLSRAQGVVAFAVSDTGIGIPAEKQKLIFEAFHQADAGTGRKYGGTGLGLAISRELATLLGGEIRLVSAPAEGSTFTLYLPSVYSGPARVVVSHTEAEFPVQLRVPIKSDEPVADDRAAIEEGDHTLLIVDDDPHYARVLLGVARERGFKGIVAARGQAALALAREFRPTAITLDVFLPDMLGWTVLNNLKLDPATRHIPVQMLSVEEERQHGLSHGAFSYLVKPATTTELEAAIDKIRAYIEPHTRRLLVVEDDDRERASIIELLGHDDIDILGVSTGAEAMAALLGSRFDCCVVDLRLPDMSGFDLLDLIQTEPAVRDIPVVVFERGSYRLHPDLQLWVDVDQTLHATTYLAATDNGQTTFVRAADTALDAFPATFEVLPTDVNGDGLADLVVAFQRSRDNALCLAVFLSDAAGGFTNAGTFETGDVAPLVLASRQLGQDIFAPPIECAAGSAHFCSLAFNISSFTNWRRSARHMAFARLLRNRARLIALNWTNKVPFQPQIRQRGYLFERFLRIVLAECALASRSGRPRRFSPAISSPGSSISSSGGRSTLSPASPISCASANTRPPSMNRSWRNCGRSSVTTKQSKSPPIHDPAQKWLSLAGRFAGCGYS